MDVPWQKTMSVWWSLAWRGLVYGALGGFVFGFIGGVIAVFMGTPENGAYYGAFGGYIAAFPASILALKQALSKHLASLASIANSSVQSRRDG